MKTSEKPVLGNWKIEAFMSHTQASLEVELKKFVLPKFQVTITPPPYVITDDDVEAEVCAK